MGRWLVALCLGLGSALAAAADKKTVCTVTINSADEKAAFSRYLSPAAFRFVELVQPGRTDWLAAACQAGIRCDVLVVSGHYDGGNEFFSDGPAGRESLPVAELERASCSEGCAGIFARLKEVYLFGCNTLNPTPLSSATADIVRSVVREGHSRAVAERHLSLLNTEYGESSRERMRQIFNDVPVIYGFPSLAPLGPVAAAGLDRYLRSGGAAEVGRGRPSARLLAQFSPQGLAATPGVSPQEARARWDVCQFADDRLTDVQVARHIHRLLRRDINEVGVHLDRIQRLTTVLVERSRMSVALALALQDIAEDFISRLRFLEAAQRVSEPPVRVRMLNLARDLAWLSAEERWQQLALMLGELQARPELGLSEINLACTLNKEGDLDGAFNRRVAAGSLLDDLPHAAVRACLGSTEARVRLVDALAGADEAEVQVAQAYLRHQPIAGGAEFRRALDAVLRLGAGDAQVRALETLGRHDLFERDTVALLLQLYAQTPSWAVQSAIAGILIRVDRRLLPATTPLLRTLRERRQGVPAGESSRIDALIARLQAR